MRAPFLCSAPLDASLAQATVKRVSRQPTILLVEDNPTHASLVERFFSRADYRVVISETGADALELMAAHSPEVVLLDLTLPAIDGFDVASEIRKVSTVPIIFLTARTSELDKIRALDLGGDDYLTKPYSLRELSARIRAVTRRTTSSGSTAILTIGPYSINWARREVTQDSSNEPISLTHKELDLLWFFATHPEEALPREYLFDKVWGSAAISSSRTLDVHVANLRKKLPGLPICTIRGTGYILAALPTAS